MRLSVILIPTFNERDNVEAMCSGILSLGLDVDLLFVDDSSPNGTGAVLDTLAADDSSISILHRPGKLGVGGAHRDGILWAYGRGYETVITMDCDFTHSPADIGRLVEASPACDDSEGLRREVCRHPLAVSLLESRAQVASVLRRGWVEPVSCSCGLLDGFVPAGGVGGEAL